MPKVSSTTEDIEEDLPLPECSPLEEVPTTGPYRDGYPREYAECYDWDYESTKLKDDDEERLINFCILQLEFLTIREKMLLKEKLYSIEDFSALDTGAVEDIIKRPLKQEFTPEYILAIARRSATLVENYGISYTVYGSSDYPELLKNSIKPPYILFWRGHIGALHKPCVSIVGTRKCTEEGAMVTQEFASSAVSNGYCVVSGLAIGVDSISHRSAICTAEEKEIYGGVTIAVLPCGLDIITPTINKSLVRSIINSGGGIVSEYLPGVGPMSYRFGLRNRIIAALSPCTIVTEAPVGSGALITARYALDLGRGLCIYSLCFTDEALERNRVILSSLSPAQQKLGKYKRCATNFKGTAAHIIEGFEDFRRLCASDYEGQGTLLE